MTALMFYFLAFPVITKLCTTLIDLNKEPVQFWESPSSRAPIEEELFVEKYGQRPFLYLEQIVINTSNEHKRFTTNPLKQSHTSTQHHQQQHPQHHLESSIDNTRNDFNSINSESGSRSNILGSTAASVTAASTLQCGVLQKNVLLMVLALQNQISNTSIPCTPELARQGRFDCTIDDICFKPRGDTRCLVHSPLEYWSMSADDIRMDQGKTQ